MTGELLALGAAVCFAAANVTIVKGTPGEADDNGAFVSLLLTAAIAGAGFLIQGMAHGFPPVTIRALAWFAGAGVLTGFIGRVFLYASVQRLGAVRASAIKRLNPFFAVALGVGFLGEAVTPGMATGMAFIVASFALLVAASFRRTGGKAGPAPNWTGYVYGPVSALGYAFGYLLRKAGLNDAPEPFLGACVGAVVGACLFAAVGAFSKSYGRAVRATFTRPRGWLITAGAMSSCGQILYFFALGHAAISRVALVASMEVFVTLALTAIFLRRREVVTRSVVAAAVLGVIGTALVFADR